MKRFYLESYEEAIAPILKETTALKHSTQNRDYWKVEAPEIAKLTFSFVLEKRRVSIIFHRCLISASA